VSKTLSQIVLGAAFLLPACTGEFQIGQQQKIPPAEPPGDKEDDVGEPPDWQNCYQGWRGVYYNLTVHDDYVDPRPDEPLAPTDPAELDWWDNPRFEKYDPTLDFGQNWWPVDEGLEEDPKYFAVYWHAWIRAWSGTTLSFSLGSADDSWVYVNGQPIASRPGIQEFVREPYEVYLEAGQYPIEVWFAHRASDASGFSFRVLQGDASICYPDFEAGE
jgi:hypothetical protein